MSGAIPFAAGWQSGPTRTLDQYLDDLVRQLRLLPMESKARGPLITRIRQIEDALDARSET